MSNIDRNHCAQHAATTRFAYVKEESWQHILWSDQTKMCFFGRGQDDCSDCILLTVKLTVECENLG